MSEDIFNKQYWNGFVKGDIEVYCKEDLHVRRFLKIIQKEKIYFNLTDNNIMSDSFIDTFCKYSNWYFSIHNNQFQWNTNQSRNKSLCVWNLK